MASILEPHHVLVSFRAGGENPAVVVKPHMTFRPRLVGEEHEPQSTAAIALFLLWVGRSRL